MYTKDQLPQIKQEAINIFKGNKHNVLIHDELDIIKIGKTVKIFSKKIEEFDDDEIMEVMPEILLMIKKLEDRLKMSETLDDVKRRVDE